MTNTQQRNHKYELAVFQKKHAQMKGLSRQLTGKFQVQSLWAPRGTGHLFVTGKTPVLTGKHAQMTGFSRLLTGKILVQSLWVWTS